MPKIRVGIYSTVATPAKRIAIVELERDAVELVRSDDAWRLDAQAAAERLGLRVQAINHVRQTHDGVDIHVAVIGCPYDLEPQRVPRPTKPPVTRGGRPIEGPRHKPAGSR